MSRRVLISGGTGNLGSHIRGRLTDSGFTVRITSRRDPQPGEGQGVDSAVGNLVTREGVAAAVDGVDVVMHCASSPFPRSVERDGGKNLIQTAKEASVKHFLYPSILGLEQISFSYYTDKLQVERMIEGFGLNYTIIRAAQFHKFLDMIIQPLARLPIVLQPRGWQFQSIYAGDVADRFVRYIVGEPLNGIERIAGPEIQTMDHLMSTWLESKGATKPVLRIPIPGGLSKGFRAGHNTDPSIAVQGLRWAEYLQRTH